MKLYESSSKNFSLCSFSAFIRIEYKLFRGCKPHATKVYLMDGMPVLAIPSPSACFDWL